LAISPQVYFEYYDVLSREENREILNISIKDVENFLDVHLQVIVIIELRQTLKISNKVN